MKFGLDLKMGNWYRKSVVTGGNDYVTLPQNLLLSAGTILEDFEAATDWTAVGGSAANNTTAGQFRTGLQSVKLTGNAGVTAKIVKTVNLDMSGDWNILRLSCYVHDLNALYNGNIMLYLGNDSGLTNAFRVWMFQNTFKRVGWHTFAMHKSQFNRVGEGSWSNPIVRIVVQFVSAAGQTPAISFDSLYWGVKSTPAIMLHFDDATTTQYNDYCSYMKSINIRGTLWAISSHVGQAGYMTPAQLQELDAAGWSIGNHTDTDTDLSTLTEEQQEAAISTCKAYLDGIGLTKASSYLCYPSGGYNEDTFTAMDAQNILLGRGLTITYGDGEPRFVMPFDNSYLLPSNSSTLFTLAQAKTQVDNAIAYGYIFPMHIHGDWSAADLYALINYRKNEIAHITIDDYYRLQSGPVRIPKVKDGGGVANVETDLLLDQFTTDESAPLTSPRTCEPGPGTLAITDGSNIMSIAGSKLVINGTPAANSQFVTGSIPFLAGKILSADIDATTGYLLIELHDSNTFSVAPRYSVLVNSTGPAVEVRDDTNGISTLTAMVNNPLSGTYAIVMRENDGTFYIKDTDLIWVGYKRTAFATLYGGGYFYHGLAQNLALDNFKLYTASPSGLNTEYGIATNVVLVPSNGETMAGDADGLYRIRWTPQASETLTFLFRRTDDDNTMKLVCDQVAGTIKLYERVAGSDTEINAGKTQTWTVATQYAITIQAWGTKIQTRVDKDIKHNTTSSVNQAVTGLKVSSDNVAPNINEFVAWPRDLSGFPFV